MRYVVLHHRGITHPHYDLMVEMSGGSGLATWRCPQWPPRPGDSFTPLGIHRREYLTFEGPVSGDRGEVNRIAEGDCAITSDNRSHMTVVFSKDFQLQLPKVDAGKK